MQALCGLQGIFDLFNCKTPGGLDDRVIFRIFPYKTLDGAPQNH